MKSKAITILLTGMLLFAGIQVSQAQINIGGGLAYGTEIENPGIGVNAEIFVKENIAIRPGLVYFFPKDLINEAGSEDFKFKWFDVNINGNYYFETDGIVKPYGMAGLNFAFLTVPGFSFDFIGGQIGTESETTTEVGLNLGGGANFELSGSVIPYAELRYVLSDADQLVISAGVRFNIN
ncbi:MAG: outer membrane beta-barrel protein [Bacteroidota bacterium]